jgi:predicted enzyme related to lactoylglutathione lyase
MTQNQTPITLGLATVIFQVPDLAAAKAWYSRAFGKTPYFDQPFYVGFEIGGFELGLHPDMSEGQAGPGGSTAYWRVSHIERALEYFLASGATLVSAAQEVGEGIKVARVADPFGNVIGLIENPHFANVR